MKRTIVLAALVLSLVSLTACGGSPGASGPGGSSAATGTPEPAGPYAAISTEGAHEKAAVAALPAALKTVNAAVKSQSQPTIDVSGATPTLVAYVIQAAETTGVTLFEVRSGGRVYELYGYPKPPNPKGLKWTPLAFSEGASLADPAGGQELAGASAVASIIKVARPGTTPTVKIYGYSFYWIKADGQPVATPNGSPFTVTIDPAGKASSWSQ